MLRVFQNDIMDPDQFVITLELVPGRESTGRSVDTVMGIARDAFSDGRISAVSVTDNPGGNPSLSPDAIGYRIFSLGMDVIVHFTCRDMNRVGMESRALQLAMMGMKNILALTGDYAGTGFGGQGAPVFDLDSVTLQILLSLISQRMDAAGDPDGFFTGCAVSPFKQSEGECFAQYAKMSRKVAAGARFVITQLGYDGRKFSELIGIQRHMGLGVPTLGSVYLLTPKAARVMHSGRVPGAVVPSQLLQTVEREWKNSRQGKTAAIERAARLGAVLRGLGYRGIHIGGIHRDFSIVGRILDRMEAIGDNWQGFLPGFDSPQPNGFYAFREKPPAKVTAPLFGKHRLPLDGLDRMIFSLMQRSHNLFFNFDAPMASFFRTVCEHLDSGIWGRLFMHLAEHPVKRLLLGCRQCGDCAIQHVGFLCPESGCPKHMRNGACGGSRQGMCEVNPDRPCVWFRAHNRWASQGKVSELCAGCVPPRMWELDRTASWLNFHLRRDHHSVGNDISRVCRETTCRLIDGKDGDG
ncbi:MAG: methylenetetrahydrofolate reductase C-terminal domain-containing protein [Desulfobacterales bacterium]|nr:methylenetetrahydrofolate reductase C-terminal domain-containing protein [Desulfobacterales bacterium]